MPTQIEFDIITTTTNEQYLRGMLVAMSFLTSLALTFLTASLRSWWSLVISLLALFILSTLSEDMSTYVLAAVSLLAIMATLSAIHHYQKHQATSTALRAKLRQGELRTTRALLQGEQRESQRVASDLHDGMGSLLSVAMRYLETNDQQVYTLLAQAQKETRLLSQSLYPKALASLGLLAALNDHITSLTRITGVPISFVTTDLQLAYPTFQQYNLYRLTEQLLNIVLLRSGVEYITLQLTEFDDFLNLIIEADGKASSNHVFPNATVRKDINLRLRALYGTANIDENPQRGITVVIDFHDPTWVQSPQD